MKNIAYLLYTVVQQSTSCDRQACNALHLVCIDLSFKCHVTDLIFVKWKIAAWENIESDTNVILIHLCYFSGYIFVII